MYRSLRKRPNLNYAQAAGETVPSPALTSSSIVEPATLMRCRMVVAFAYPVLL